MSQINLEGKLTEEGSRIEGLGNVTSDNTNPTVVEELQKLIDHHAVKVSGRAYGQGAYTEIAFRDQKYHVDYSNAKVTPQARTIEEVVACIQQALESDFQPRP